MIGVWFLTAEAFTHWLSVALVCERLFAINWPFHARRVASARKALVLCLLVLILVLLLEVCSNGAIHKVLNFEYPN